MSTSARVEIASGCAEIDGARCVHALAEVATCQACASVCPSAALALTDEALALDTARCDGCGLCLPACPEGAISVKLAQRDPVSPSHFGGTLKGIKGRGGGVGDKPPLRRLPDGSLAMLAACGKTGLTGAGIVPCLHALGLADLLAAARAGALDWQLAHADCATCERGKNDSLTAALVRANALLADRGRPALRATRLPPAAWDKARAAARDPKATATLSRRAFFRTLVSETAHPFSSADPAPGFVPPGALLPEGDGRLPWCVFLDAVACTGCDACARSCPHAAIVLDREAECYRLDARQCTGCGLCVDVCETGAVRLAAFARPGQDRLALSFGRCRACGSPFHVPQGKAGELCPICARVNHHRHLFQVIN